MSAETEAARREQRQHDLGLIKRQHRGLLVAYEAIEQVAVIRGSRRRMRAAKRYLDILREINAGRL